MPDKEITEDELREHGQSHYNPKPVFEVIASNLVDAINDKDWEKVHDVYVEVKKLSDY